MISKPVDGRSRTRLATRQSISDAATRLFTEQGFDSVTVDEIAKAANVGRMTVFNHFPRKEDMFFDRDEEIREILRNAIRQRAQGTSPIEALRLLAHRLAAESSPYLEFSAAGQRFIETIERSETLKARVRAIRGEIAQHVAAALSESAGQEPGDPIADLASNLLLAALAVARGQAHHAFVRSHDPERAQAVFLALFDRGIVGLKAAMADTPYA